MIQPTARAVLLMAAGAPLALLVGVIAPALWPIGFGWALFVALAIAADVAMAPRLAAPARIAVPSTLAVGGAAMLAIEAPGAAQAAIDADARLVIAPPAPLAVADGHAQLSLVAMRRGTARVAALWLRAPGPLGLVRRQRREARDEAIRIVADTRAVREEAPLFLQQVQSGDRARRETGSGTEFQSLAAFAPGMDKRAIDWKQSARHATLLARDWRVERNNQIMLAIDAGRAMAEPLAGVPRVDRAVSAALLAGYVALKADDRVGLFAYAEAPVAACGVAAGTAAFAGIQRAAAAIDYGTRETNHVLGLTRLAERLDRRTLVILFTELADPTAAELMLRACAPLLSRHLLLFLAFRDAELDALVHAEPRTPEDVTRAVAAHALLRDRAVVAARLRRMGAHVVEAPHDRAGSALVDAYLGLRRQGLL